MEDRVDLSKLLTLGQVAVKLGVLDDQLRRMCDRKEIAFIRFLGRRMLHADHIEQIREKCVARGYIKSPVEVANAAR